MSDYHFGFCEKCGGSVPVDSNTDFNDHADCTGCGETNSVRDMFPIWPPDPTATPPVDAIDPMVEKYTSVLEQAVFLQETMPQHGEPEKMAECVDLFQQAHDLARQLTARLAPTRVLYPTQSKEAPE